MNADTQAITRAVLAAGGTTADLARALGVSWGTAKHHRRREELREAKASEHPVAVLRVVVVFDDPVLAATLSPAHRRKLAGGIVCTGYPFGVSIGWGHSEPRTRVEQAQLFADVDAAIAWLLERAEGLRLTAQLCPGTATALFSCDRAEFLNCCATILRRHAPRLWAGSERSD